MLGQYFQNMYEFFLPKHLPIWIPTYFQNLAISDLLFVIICIPSTAISYARDWPFGDVFCRLFQYINYVTCYGSVITLILLSLDRYLAVVYPVKSISWRTVCNTTMIIIVTWIITLAVCSPILWIHKAIDLEYVNRNTVCRYVIMKKKEKKERKNICLFGSLFKTT